MRSCATALLLSLSLCGADVAAQALQKQAKIVSPLRDAPPVNGNPQYPAASYFGRTLSVSGDTAAISERDPSNEQRIRIHRRDGAGVWQAMQAVLPPEAMGPSLRSSFGWQHALDGGRLAVALQDGSADALVIIYEDAGSTWQETARIQGLPYLALNGSFGHGGVRLSGNTLALGSPGRVQGAYGAVHVFVHDGAQWTLQQVVTEDDPVSATSFGQELELQGDRLVVHRPGRSGDAAPAVYVFEREAGIWSQAAKIMAPPDGAGTVGYFGRGLALDGSRLALPDLVMRTVGGASYPFDVVRIFERDAGGTWSLADSLETGAVHTGSPAPTLSVALRGSRLLVGQTWLQDDLYAGTVPRVHLFELGSDGWSEPVTRSPFDWEAGWIAGAPKKVRYGAGFADAGTGGGGTIAFDDRGSALIGALLDGIVVPLQVPSYPPGAVYVLTDSTGLFCDGFEDNDPLRCESLRPAGG